MTVPKPFVRLLLVGPLLAVVLIGLSLPPVPLMGQPATVDANAINRQLSELDAEEAKILAAIDQNEKDKVAHNKRGEAIDPTDENAVNKFNQEAEEGKKNRQRLEMELADNRKQQQHLLDRIELPALKARIKALESEVAKLEDRVKRQQELMKRLGEESLKDVKELEAAAEESRKADLIIAREVLDQLVGLAGEIGKLSKVLDKIDLRRFAGPTWKDFREAVKEMRETAEFFNSKDVQQTIKKLEASKDAIKKAVEIAHDPKSATKVDEVVSNASKLMQWAIKECELKTKVGNKIEKLLQDLPLKQLEEVGGPSTLNLLGQAGKALSLGETAIKCWEARGEQMLADREVNRITNEVERRNALINSYSPGGSHFMSHKHDVSLLKAAREEKRRIEGEIKEVEVRLSRSDP